MALPGWNSSEFVRSAHESLEGLAIAFFAALVICDVISHFETPRHRLFERMGLVCFAVAVLMEVIAYPYGKRNDQLADVAIGLAQERALRAETANLQTRKDLEKERQITADKLKGAADAELKRDQFLARQIFGRRADAGVFAPLKLLPMASAIVLFKKDDGEAAFFAATVKQELHDDIGWNVTGPSPIDASEAGWPLIGMRL